MFQKRKVQNFCCCGLSLLLNSGYGHLQFHQF